MRVPVECVRLVILGKFSKPGSLFLRLILRGSALDKTSSSAVERQLPKLDVAGSIPVSRSILKELWLALIAANSFTEFSRA